MPEGTYLAWLSDSNGNSPAGINPTDTADPFRRFVPSPAPYILPDGTQIAADFEDLTGPDAILDASINIDATGTPISFPDGVWTNTTVNGGSKHDNLIFTCVDWSFDADSFTGSHGLTEDPGSGGTPDFFEWTDLGIAGCQNPFRLYCFQQ